MKAYINVVQITEDQLNHTKKEWNYKEFENLEFTNFVKCEWHEFLDKNSGFVVEAEQISGVLMKMRDKEHKVQLDLVEDGGLFILGLCRGDIIDEPFCFDIRDSKSGLLDRLRHILGNTGDYTPNGNLGEIDRKKAQRKDWDSTGDVKKNYGGIYGVVKGKCKELYILLLPTYNFSAPDLDFLKTIAVCALRPRFPSKRIADMCVPKVKNND